MLLDEATLRKITRLALLTTRIRRGALKGARRSVRHGASATFADYRPYVPGDDLRRLDWNIYARLDRPFLKLFEEEEDQSVYLLLDCSRSMDWSSGPSDKFTYAKTLAAALGAIALHGGDRLSLVPLTSLLPSPSQGEGPGVRVSSPLPVTKLELRVSSFRSPASAPRLFAALDALQPAGGSDLTQALRQAGPLLNRPGLVIFISDLLADWDVNAGLAALQAHGQEIVLVHVLSPEELDPPLSGDLKLTDVETGQTLDASLDPGMLAAYRRRLDEWQSGLRETCTRRAIYYLPTSSGLPWERLVLQEMRRMGVVR